MQAFESTGLWWLPGHEAERIAGTLKVSDSGNLQLSLVGGIGTISPTNISKSHQIILGSVDESPAGNDVTLAGCLLTDSTFGSFANTREKYHASRGFFGAHLVDKSACVFKQAAIRISGLLAWANTLSGIKLEYQGGNRVGEKVPLASYTMHSPISGDVPGGKVSLYVGLGYHHNSRELAFRDTGSLSVACDKPKSADEISKEYFYPLQNLMTFVCDRAQEVESFSVWRTDTLKPLEDPEIQVIGPRIQPANEDTVKEPVQFFQMLFTLKDIDFADFVGKWMSLTVRYSDACNIFFGLKYGPPAFIEMTFLGIVQVLHLYHSRREDGLAWRGEEEMRLKEIIAANSPTNAEWIIDHVGAHPRPTLERVLRQLVDQHSSVMNPLVSSRQDRFVNEVMNTFHYVIHREPEVYVAANYGADLYWLVEKLRFLTKACFLSELTFSEQKTLTLFERNALYQHMCKLEAGYESRRNRSHGATG